MEETESEVLIVEEVGSVAWPVEVTEPWVVMQLGFWVAWVTDRGVVSEVWFVALIELWVGVVTEHWVGHLLAVQFPPLVLVVIPPLVVSQSWIVADWKQGCFV